MIARVNRNVGHFGHGSSWLEVNINPNTGNQSRSSTHPVKQRCSNSRGGCTDSNGIGRLQEAVEEAEQGHSRAEQASRRAHHAATSWHQAAGSGLSSAEPRAAY